MKRRSLAGLGVVTLMAALWWWHGHALHAEPRVAVAGGDAGGWPRAQPEEEQFDAAALAGVARDSAAQGVQVLLVARHGHLVLERYGHGIGVDTPVDPGFSAVLLALSAGIAAQGGMVVAPAPAQLQPTALCQALIAALHPSYAEFLSRELWRRLNAADAWLVGPVDQCRVEARAGDWLRVGLLLLDDGQFEGAQILPPGWVQHLRLAVYAAPGLGLLAGRAAHGAQPPSADDVFFVRGRDHWRLWIVPSRQLLMLSGADTPRAASSPSAVSDWDELALLRSVLRALPAPPSPSPLNGLVPGH